MVKETSWNSPAQIQIYMAKSLIPYQAYFLHSKELVKYLEQLFVLEQDIGQREMPVLKKLKKF